MIRRFPTRLLTAALAAFALLLAGVASAQLSAIQERGSASFVMSGAYPPFSMPAEDGSMVGFDADVAAELAERLGIEAEIEQAPFSSIVAGVQTGRYDVSVASHAKTEERAQAVQYLDFPYYYSGAQLFVPSDSEYESFEDLQEAGAPIAVDVGGTNQQWLEEQGYPNIATYEGVQESLVAVRTGRAAAIFTSPIVGNLAIRDQGFDLKPIDGLLFEENAWITIAQDQPELKAALEEALRAMQEDGTLEAISMEWIGADITTPPSESEGGSE